MPNANRARQPLNRERILRAALELVDQQGIDALTMRALGDSLGFEAMALYKHVANKDEVLDGILDLVLAQTDPPVATAHWTTAIKQSAASVHAALRRHPWASTLVMSPRHLRPARLRYMELLLGRLRDAGFSPEITFDAYHVLDGYIFGFSIWEASHTYTADEAASMKGRFEGTVTEEAFPHLHQHGLQHFDDVRRDEARAFELGLDLIVDRLEALAREAASSSQGDPAPVTQPQATRSSHPA